MLTTTAEFNRVHKSVYVCVCVCVCDNVSGSGYLPSLYSGTDVTGNGSNLCSVSTNTTEKNSQKMANEEIFILIIFICFACFLDVKKPLKSIA